jgi:hypothetical protein
MKRILPAVLFLAALAVPLAACQRRTPLHGQKPLTAREVEAIERRMERDRRNGVPPPRPAEPGEAYFVPR